MPFTLTQELVDEYLRHLELNLARGPATVRGYRDELTRLVSRGVVFEPKAIARWVATAEDGSALAPNTRNRRLVMLRAFVRFLVEKRYIRRSEDPTRELKRARVPRDREAALVPDELRRVLGILHGAPPSWRRTRDEAILLTLFGVGLRVTELRNLDLHQVDLVTRTLRGALRKGGGYVDAPLTAEVADGLERWMRVRPATADPAVFVAGPKLRRLTVRAIQKRLRDLGQAAGLSTSLHPHALRHAHATALYRRGVDLRVIGQSLNHASIRTTQRYVHTDLETLRTALDKLPPLLPAPQGGKTDAPGSGTISGDSEKS